MKLSRNEQVKQKLFYMVETASGDIQDQLDKFFVKVIEKFVLSQANRSTAMKVNSNENVEMRGQGGNDQKSTGASVKIAEQIINKEIEALLQLMIDLYLGQLLL